ncbi:MAG: hypothetical protein ACRDPV_11645 [Gaiellaceae bacterium]
MTNNSSYTWLHGALWSARNTQNAARKAFEVALVLFVAAALTGAWLAFFTFVPLDFSSLRPR